jgi:hypothetical protein
MKHLTKTRILVLGAVAALAISAGAYAYFTAGGTGSGSASVGSASAITITQTGTTGPSALYPAGPGMGINLKVANPGSGTQHVNEVHLASVTSSDAQCDTTAFTMPDISVDQTVPANGSVDDVSGMLTMANNGHDQNACQGATLTLGFTSD